MTKRAVSERGSLPRSTPTPLLRSLLTGTIAALALGAGAMSAHALNGKSGEHADTEGLFQVQASCQSLRSATGLPGGDLIFACDPDGEQCHLVSGTTDEGQALGFCADSVPDAMRPYRGGKLETGVVVSATSFGTDIGYALPAPPVSAGDIFCETFENTATPGKKTIPSPGRKVCVDVFKGSCPGGTCGAGDGSIVVRTDTCNTVRQILAASVTSEAFQNLAYWLFIDLDKTGQKNSEVLSVCPGFAWEFLPLSEPVADEVTVKYQVSKSVLQTPGCFKKADGSWCCYCTLPKKQCFVSSPLPAKYVCDLEPGDTVCDGL